MSLNGKNISNIHAMYIAFHMCWVTFLHSTIPLEEEKIQQGQELSHEYESLF